MGTAQVKSKQKSTKSLIEPPKITIQLHINPQKQIPVELTQLCNWSLAQIKTVYQTYQRIAESPMLDSFLFKKIMPFSKKNSQAVFQVLVRGDQPGGEDSRGSSGYGAGGGRFVSVFELIGVLVMAAYQTYRKKFQFLCLIFDLQHKGYINGKQFLLVFYSLLYGYCRLTNHNFPSFQTTQKFAKASFFQGQSQQNFQQKPVSLHKFIQQYDGNTNISTIFNRFERFQFKEIKEDPLVFCIGEFRPMCVEDVKKFQRILGKVYGDGDYGEVWLIEENRQLRRQNRRDSCYRQLIEDKMAKFQSPPKTRRTQSHAKLTHLTPTTQNQKLLKTPNTHRQPHQSTSTSTSNFRIKKPFPFPTTTFPSPLTSPLTSTHKHKPKPPQKRNLIFLNGHTHSKNEIFETINYFKIFAEADNKISIKDFFKKFDNKAYMKKQLSSIFRYLDYQRNGEITLRAFFKSFYPGIKEADLQVLFKWYSQYREIYQADSLARNQVKAPVMTDARVLPYDTYDRMRQIFKAMDMGNKGYLIFQDLRKAYRQGFTADELQNMLSQYGDGQKILLNGLCKMLLPYGWTIQGVDLEGKGQ